MKLGDLNDRVEFYTITSTPDGQGGQATPVYTKIATRYANVTQLSESEIMRSGLNVGERTYQITLLKSPNESLSKSLQIRHGTKRLNITSVIPSGYYFKIIAHERNS